MTEDDRPTGDGAPGDDPGGLADAALGAADTASDSHGRPGADELAAWDQVVADMEATVEEYREDGWDVMGIHPGDVAVRTAEDRHGLDVLVPDDEYERLASLLSGDVALEECRVFRATDGSVVYLVVAMEDPEAETAVVYPAYYDATDPGAMALLRRARADGELRSYLRVLGGEYVELSHGDPSLFVPDDGDA